MFGWWKKNEGFEWREYVRTTILVRRQRRRENLEQVKMAAVASAKVAGKAGAKVGASGIAKLKQGAGALAMRLRRTTIAILARIGAMPGRLSRWLGATLKPLARIMAGSSARGPMLVIGALATAAALFRWITWGLGTEVIVAGGLGLVGLGLGLLPTLLLTDAKSRPAWLGAISAGLPKLPKASPVVIGGLIVTALVAVVGYGAMRTLAPGASGSLLARLPFVGSRLIEGRAVALSGDMLKVGNVVVRLTGIEAPEIEQRCGAGGKKTWPCGEAAKEVLSKVVRGKSVSCSMSGADQAGRSLASCRVEGTDIAVNLVRQGHVFAQQGMFARYTSVEAEARGAKAGVWRSTTPRPTEWRAKRWEEAKREAPSGCPIKGAVSADGKFYVLPWSREYERIRVRSGRGERWFCSEQEARTAGWRSAERS